MGEASSKRAEPPETEGGAAGEETRGAARLVAETKWRPPLRTLMLQGWYMSYHITVLSGKLSHAICQANDREGGGCLLLNDLCNNTGRPVAEVLWDKHPDKQVPPRLKSHMRSLQKKRK